MIPYIYYQLVQAERERPVSARPAPWLAMTDTRLGEIARSWAQLRGRLTRAGRTVARS